MKNKRFVGLDRYQIEFKDRKEMNDWIEKNCHKWECTEIFIENGICLEIHKKVRISL